MSRKLRSWGGIQSGGRYKAAVEENTFIHGRRRVHPPQEFGAPLLRALPRGASLASANHAPLAMHTLHLGPYTDDSSERYTWNRRLDR